jgi:lysophospholipid acyltransferase (LPLAT)-like uncharacterized protein
VILARRTGSPISAVHFGLQWAITFRNAWDLFQVPLPFSAAVMFIAPPIYVPKEGGPEVMKQKQEEVQAAMERVRDAAESWFNLTEAERDNLRDRYHGRISQQKT